MKTKKILAFLMAALMVISLIGCSKSESKEGEKTQEGNTTAALEQGQEAESGEVNIDVILKTTASEYWQYVQAGALAYMQEHPEVKVKVVGAASETAYDEQLQIIETDMGSGEYDAFVIAPLQSDMVGTKIANTDKPVIAVDTKIESDKVLSFVGTGNKDASKLGGEAAAKLAKERGWSEIKAVAISGVQGDSTATDRLEGYKEGVESAGGTFLDNEVQYANAVADQAVACMEGIMQKFPEGIAIVVCNNDDMAMGAAKAAAKNEAYKNTVFVGFDGNLSTCEAILEDRATLSVAQDAYGMGYKAVEAAHKAVQGETLDKFIDSGASIVSKDNAAERKATLEGYLKK